jgi:hypothetical protein
MRFSVINTFNLFPRFWAFVSDVAEDVGELHDALKEVGVRCYPYPPLPFTNADIDPIAPLEQEQHQDSRSTNDGCGQAHRLGTVLHRVATRQLVRRQANFVLVLCDYLASRARRSSKGVQRRCRRIFHDLGQES